MGTYFHEMESIFSKLPDRLEETLSTIASRYIGNNPSHPMTYRVFCSDGLKRSGDYRYDFNFDDRFPNAKDGQYVYAWAKLWHDHSVELALAVNCYGPVRIYVNDEQVFKSSILEETDPNRKTAIRVAFNKGWNHVVVRFMKTASGFGGVFGTGSYKNFPLHFLAPSPEREGQEGWIFTEPQGQELKLPVQGTTEASTGLRWLPEICWNEKEEKAGQFARIYGIRNNQYAVAWVNLQSSLPGKNRFVLSGRNQGAISLQVDGEEIFSTHQDGQFQVPLHLTYGSHDLLIKSSCGEQDWGFKIEPVPNDGGLRFHQPYPVAGARDEWLYLGPFSHDESSRVEKMTHMDSLFENPEGGTFWRVDLPNSWVRPYLENSLFGKWNYPLGVTLYGLLRTGRELGREDIVNYVLKHIETCTSLHEYSLWDRQRYGAAGVNNQLSAVDSLDDCGSFGATMLASMQESDIKGSHAVMELIADYIANKQDRLPDGALYRVHGSVEFMKDTMWCDDLYMSTPFLCRYYERTGDIRYLNDAAKQFLLYKKYMYIPDLQIMSHVYDFKFQTATKIPWGRGNGWVLFSLSELLAILPEEDPHRDDLLHFFRELCAGYLKLQGGNGLWHQVLTDPESYEETSCTSMFVYAFARGVRYGWLTEQADYIEAVTRGWEGLTKISIDKLGNIYGVCRGSGYSFSADYYKHELPWLLNDTHGIGIVMLAGIESLKLRKWLAEGI